MKKTILSSLSLLLTTMLVAQPSPGAPLKPPPPLAERWKKDSIKLNLYVVPLASQMANIHNIFYLFYNELDALVQNNKTAPPAKEAIDKIIDARKNALRGVLAAPAFDRFETFEREFMPPPPPPGRPGMHEHLHLHEQVAPTPNT